MTDGQAVQCPGQGAARRVIQFIGAAIYRHNPETDRKLRALVQNEEQWQLLLRLSAFDRAHHLRVHDMLLAAGHSDPDLLLAAVLHDVGKADDCGRVWLAHRGLKVLLQAIAPRLLDRLTRHDAGRPGHGLFLAQHHPRLGAELARQAAVPPSCAELIAGHEDPLPVDDPRLHALIQADAEAIA
jgi:hypothetical protein